MSRDCWLDLDCSLCDQPETCSCSCHGREDGEQCIYCLRFTYHPGYGCTRCGRGLAGDEVSRHD